MNMFRKNTKNLIFWNRVRRWNSNAELRIRFFSLSTDFRKWLLHFELMLSVIAKIFCEVPITFVFSLMLFLIEENKSAIFLNSRSSIPQYFGWYCLLFRHNSNHQKKNEEILWNFVRQNHRRRLSRHQAALPTSQNVYNLITKSI